VLVLAIVVLLVSVVMVVRADTFEIDKEGEVAWVKDGDSFNLTSGEEIRFADINAPEWNETGGPAAKNYLISFFNSYGNHLFLDIDDLARNDTWGRLICVAFVSYNGTHYINVNKQMIEEGHAWVWNFTNNEFNPDTWTLFVAKAEVVPEFTTFLGIPLLIITISALSILFRREAEEN
jgi:endonuclease YncB( thermonuclease family)